MLRKFINQDGLSNKFWIVEVSDKIQTITFGKIGTKGRESVKEFSTEKECISETEKLISQKLRKGYTEIKEDDLVPEKTKLSEDEKAEVFFWESIEKSNKLKNAHWSEYDIDEHIDNLTELLSKSGKQRLILFEKCLQEKLNELYTAEIAELSIILECGFKTENDIVVFDDYLSDDGFIYFRCWLLLKGKDFFEDIKNNINSFISGRYSFNIGDCWAEGLLYVADEAYAMNHDNEDMSAIRDAVSELFPAVIHYDSMERQMSREPKGGEHLQKMYPDLVKVICEVRTE